MTIAAKQIGAIRRRYRKLTDSVVADLRLRRQIGQSVTAIARCHDIDRAYVSRVVRGIERPSAPGPITPPSLPKSDPDLRRQILAHVLAGRRHFGHAPSGRELARLVERDRKLVGHIRSCVVTWIERFWGHVDRRPSIESCWPWRGGIVSRLGRAPVGRYMDGASKSYRAHRLAWEFVIGTIPAGKIVVQTCSNTLCCNPRHLMLRGRRGLKQKRVLPQ
jgi:hypothetical protein